MTPESLPSRPAGRLLVLEGVDGCGKTTQIEVLQRWLPQSGLLPPSARLLTTREPGGTPFGLILRELLLHPPEGASPCGTAELLLYAADRAQHVACRLRPALTAGDWVLSDRYSGSTLAYQGYGRGVPLATITDLERIATDGLQADLTLWLDLPAEEALRRRGGRRADRIEAAGESFLRRVCGGFERLAADRGWLRIDASLPPAAVTEACIAAIRQALASPQAGAGADG